MEGAHDDLEQRLWHIAAGAERELALFSESLTPRIYGSTELAATLRSLVTGHARHRVRILVRRPEQVLSDGAHRLVELARTIPSRIQIRAATPPADTLRAEWIIADRQGYLLRHEFTDDHAVARRDDAGRAAALLAQFETYWAHGAPSRELAALRL